MIRNVEVCPICEGLAITGAARLVVRTRKNGERDGVPIYAHDGRAMAAASCGRHLAEIQKRMMAGVARDWGEPGGFIQLRTTEWRVGDYDVVRQVVEAELLAWHEACAGQGEVLWTTGGPVDLAIDVTPDDVIQLSQTTLN